METNDAQSTTAVDPGVALAGGDAPRIDPGVPASPSLRVAPAAEAAAEVQGLAAGAEAALIEVVDATTQFESLETLAKRFGVAPYAVLHRFEGRVLFVKWIAGKPLLRTVDVERVFA